MNKRTRSESPVQARKRYASTTSISNSKISQCPIPSVTEDTAKTVTSPSSSPEHSPTMRSLPFRSESTLSQLTSDTNNSVLRSHSHERNPPNVSSLKGASIGTPPVVSTFASMVTPRSRTPDIHQGPSRHGTVISPYIANGFHYSTSTCLVNYATAELYPVFKTGDVLIKTDFVTPPRQWQLHSNILARFSSWFTKSLSSLAATATGATWASNTIEEIDGKDLLVQQQLTGEEPIIRDTNNSTLDKITIKTENEDSDSKPSFGITPDHIATIDTYDQIFSACYNIPVLLPTSHIADSLTHSE
ncbi:hypothetical protein G6011_01067 [Alternaria panax]|uniref:Uncharacterized protein n=1 Tax=Alternaria panax TaxID=48097 RepID=A0AAD4IKC1_9PLEO|nr:hypothetical protein G6011_01067 [Alternaria panax]